MTDAKPRREQIEEAAKEFAQDNNGLNAFEFIKGAEWADANPKTLITMDNNALEYLKCDLQKQMVLKDAAIEKLVLALERAGKFCEKIALSNITDEFHYSGYSFEASRCKQALSEVREMLKGTGK